MLRWRRWGKRKKCYRVKMCGRKNSTNSWVSPRKCSTGRNGCWTVAELASAPRKERRLRYDRTQAQLPLPAPPFAQWRLRPDRRNRWKNPQIDGRRGCSWGTRGVWEQKYLPVCPIRHRGLLHPPDWGTLPCAGIVAGRRIAGVEFSV